MKMGMGYIILQRSRIWLQATKVSDNVVLHPHDKSTWTAKIFPFSVKMWWNVKKWGEEMPKIYSILFELGWTLI